MAIDEEEAGEAVARQRHHGVAHDGDKGGRPQRHRAGEVEVVLRHAHRDGRRHQRADLLAAPRPIISAVSASVPIRPVGPCCSVEPIGMMMPVLVLR